MHVVNSCCLRTTTAAGRSHFVEAEHPATSAATRLMCALVAQQRRRRGTAARAYCSTGTTPQRQRLAGEVARSRRETVRPEYSDCQVPDYIYRAVAAAALMGVVVVAMPVAPRARQR